MLELNNLFILITFYFCINFYIQIFFFMSKRFFKSFPLFGLISQLSKFVVVDALDGEENNVETFCFYFGFYLYQFYSCPNSLSLILLTMRRIRKRKQQTKRLKLPRKRKWRYSKRAKGRPLDQAQPLRVPRKERNITPLISICFSPLYTLIKNSVGILLKRIWKKFF